MNCANCGTVAHPSTPYCVQCGTPIPVAASAIPPGPPPQAMMQQPQPYYPPQVYPPQGYPRQYAPPPAQYPPQGRPIWNSDVGLLAGLQSAPQQQQYGYQPAPGPTIPYANFAVRLIALFIDEFIAFSVAGMAGGLVIGAGMLMALIGLSTQTQGGAGSGIVAGLASYFIAFPVAFFAYVFYFIKLETGPQQATLGKMMLGIKIVDATTGQRISVGQSLGRFVVKNLFSGWFFAIGFLMALFTEKKQALHDMAGGTLVVQK